MEGKSGERCSEVGGLMVDGLGVVVPVPRFFAWKPTIARWRVLLAFGLFCCIAPFVWPRESCGPDRGMPPLGPCLN